ncbi:MAG TPA: hypothetical protein VKV29_01580 [Chthonomonas sp.]|uniref:hypothetical protein n=1 Tax=Chthonomonas sp. TaxID=2282153 RepID=UPI002B4AE83B|nr:hypothetical protein [Chthonomonas sp.]HLH78953.1 hypothetical protein [Chthonomonas sp.]
MARKRLSLRYVLLLIILPSCLGGWFLERSQPKDMLADRVCGSASDPCPASFELSVPRFWGNETDNYVFPFWQWMDANHVLVYKPQAFKDTVGLYDLKRKRYLSTVTLPSSLSPADIVCLVIGYYNLPVPFSLSPDKRWLLRAYPYQQHSRSFLEVLCDPYPHTSNKEERVWKAHYLKNLLHYTDTPNPPIVSLRWNRDNQECLISLDIFNLWPDDPPCSDFLFSIPHWIGQWYLLSLKNKTLTPLPLMRDTEPAGWLDSKTLVCVKEAMHPEVVVLRLDDGALVSSQPHPKRSVVKGAAKACWKTVSQFPIFPQDVVSCGGNEEREVLVWPGAMLSPDGKRLAFLCFYSDLPSQDWKNPFWRMMGRWFHIRKPVGGVRVELEVVDLASHHRQVVAVTRHEYYSDTGRQDTLVSLPCSLSWADNDTAVVYSVYPSLKVYKIRL